MLPFLVSQSELISLIPKSLSKTFTSTFNLRTFAPPIAFPPLTLYLLWRRGKEKDPRFSWLLQELKRAFASLDGDEEKNPSL